MPDGLTRDQMQTVLVLLEAAAEAKRQRAARVLDLLANGYLPKDAVDEACRTWGPALLAIMEALAALSPPTG